jgi:hypothetical protein
MSAVRTATNPARDSLEAIRALDPRLPMAMQNADLALLDAVRSDIARRWRDDEADGTEDRA